MTFRHLTAPEFIDLAPALVDLYIAAMKYPVTIRDQRIAVWRRDAASSGFAAIAAYDGDQLAGIAYGFKGTRDKWWDLQLRRGLFRPVSYTHLTLPTIYSV